MAVADQPIIIRTEVDTDGAVTKVDNLTQAVGGLGTRAAQTETQTDAAGSSIQSMGNATSSAAQKIQGVTGAVQGLLGQIGSSNRTAGLISSVAGATAQFSAMGATLGPGGALVGGLAGLAAGLYAVVDANNDVTRTANEARQALEGLAARRISDREREAFGAEISSGAISGLRSGSDIELAAEQRRIELEHLNDEVRNANADFARARAAIEGAGGELSEDRVRNRREELEGFRRERDRLRGELNTLEGETARREAIAINASRPGSAAASGGGGRAEEDYLTEVDFAERYRDESARILAERLEETRAINDDELTLELERWEAEMEAARTALDQRKEMEQAAYEARKELYIQEANERKELEVAEYERRLALDEAAIEQREATGKEIAGLFSQTTAALGDSLKAIAGGEKTAEEAFKGLAASFLEMISQYAAMKAATEFADAAASFARYDFGGGAAHVGAGLAFTAVAVATGVGAAVINQPPQAPARPEAAQNDGGGGGGGDVIINWNSPVVTAGTRAELGREVSTLVGEAASI